MADLRTTITVDVDVFLGLVDQHGVSHRRATEHDLEAMGYADRNDMIERVDYMLGRLTLGIGDAPDLLGMLDDEAMMAAPMGPLRALLHDAIRTGQCHVHELSHADRTRLSNALTGYVSHPDTVANNDLARLLGDLRANLKGGRRAETDELELLRVAADALRTP